MKSNLNEQNDKFNMLFFPIVQKDYEKNGIKNETSIDLTQFETGIAVYDDPKFLYGLLTSYNSKQRIIIDYDPNNPNKVVIKRRFYNFDDTLE